MHLLLLLSIYSLCIILPGHTKISLYNTETNNIAQYGYCVYVTTNSTIKYCWRGNTTDLFSSTINNECINGGIKRSFIELVSKNISPTEVLSWSSSVERADLYANYYYNQQVDSKDNFVCHCTLPGTFGLQCEFELLHEAVTFDEAIKSQFGQKKTDPGAMQQHGNILCYNSIFECDYGLLCLDWRDICDGQQQCMNGTDEENCDLMEFNECEKDEYRCVNGMCIDEEYWLDGM